MNYDFPVYEEKTRRLLVDRRNPLCPLSRVVGQDAAVALAADICFKALGRKDHFVDTNLILVGNASTGKTHLASAIAETLDLIHVLTDAQQIRRNDDLAHLVLEAWAKRCPVPLAPTETYGETQVYHPDSTLLFIDEIHGLSPTAQDGMLKATERSDGMLFCKKKVIDLRKAFWIGATTEWGDLLPPFRTRFLRVQLYPYTAKEVAQIIHQQCKWDKPLCEKLVYYGGTVPREAIQFGRMVESAAQHAGTNMLAVVEEVARREGIDQFGMRVQRLALLRALSTTADGLLLRHLVGATGLAQKELLDYWLPPLLNAAPGELPLVVYDSRYFLTDRGSMELKRRKLL